MIEAKAEVTHNGNKVWIYAYYGVTFANNTNYSAIVPASIIYDNTGSNPTYYKGDWLLEGVAEGTTVTWQIHYYIDTSEYNDTYPARSGRPYLDNNNNFIVPSLYTISGTNIAIEAKIGDDVVYN